MRRAMRRTTPRRLLPSNLNTKSPCKRTHLEQLLREAGKYVFPGQIVARDGYTEAVAAGCRSGKVKRRSAQEAGREIRDVLAKIVAQWTSRPMILDLSFKQLIAAAKMVPRPAGSADRYIQMIENIQRDDLNAPEIAAFVAERLEQAIAKLTSRASSASPGTGCRATRRSRVCRSFSGRSLPARQSVLCMNSTRLGVSSPTRSRPYAQHRRASPTQTPVSWLAKFARKSAAPLQIAKGPLELNQHEAA